MAEESRVGSVRPSQLLWTYGPGAMIDLPNFSVMTMGLDDWKQDHCHPIEEQRLLEQVRKACGPQVVRMLQPPVSETEKDNPHDPASYIGVPVRPFPRWFRCVKCGLMAPYDSGLFKIQDNFYKPERVRVVHEGCPKGNGRPVDAVPVRFLVACKHGHIDDFPWRWFVHDGPTTCQEPLKFFEDGASLQTENLWVKCGCGKAKSLAKAFGETGRKSLPACRGRHPHFGIGPDSLSECKEQIRPILLGATNSWFPVTISVLAIPTRETAVAQAVADNWKALEVVTSKEMLDAFLMMFKATRERTDLTAFDAKDIWAAIEDERKPKKAGADSDADIKVPEWNELTSENPKCTFPHFVCKKGVVPAKFTGTIRRVLLLDKLRKVNALVGFTRIEARDEFAEGSVDPSPLCRNGKPEWVPACEVFGEGIFLQFEESVIKAWEQTDGVKAREKILREAYEGWRDNRGLDKNVGFPGARYYMLHTIAHLFIRELSLQCGYNAASIQERIYAKPGEKPMAGILIYTAAADSDGTLGGLVAQGAPDKLEQILVSALEKAKTCSSDPICSQHSHDADWSLHEAACHACAFVAETSCEVGNRYLDRALVVPTYSDKDAAFYKDI